MYPSGDVATQSRAVTGLQRYRWKVGRLHSTGWRVKVDADVAASASPGTTTTTVTASATGARTGDEVLLLRWMRGRAVVVGRAAVDAAGSATFEVATPRRRKVFAVKLLGTRDHTAARAKVVLTPPKAEEPSPAP